jgi:hypothetical protein
MNVDQQRRVEKTLLTTAAEREVTSALQTRLTAKPYAQRLGLVLSMLDSTKSGLTDAPIMEAIPPENMESWIDAAEDILRGAIEIRKSVEKLAERLGPNVRFVNL